MMLVLNLSRSYRGLAFRVTVPRGRQGTILEVMKHKRTVLRRIDRLSDAAQEMEAMFSLTNVRITVSFLVATVILPKQHYGPPSALFLPALTLDDGILRWMSTALRTLRDEHGY